MIKISFITFLIFSLISVTLNAQDPYSPDTVYFKASGSYSDDTIFVPQTDPPWDIIIDVMVWADSAVSGVTIPLADTCYDAVNMPTYLDSMKNQWYDGTETHYIWAEGSLIEDWGIINLNLYGIGTPTPPNFLVGGVEFAKKFNTPGMLARLVFTVNNLGCLCLDTIPAFNPGEATLSFTTPYPKKYKPVFLSKCFVISQSVNVPEKEESFDSKQFQLFPNYPNPFNPTTTIPFHVSCKGQGASCKTPIPTTLVIYNILGQKVRTLVDEPKKPGEYEVVWDGKDEKGNPLSSGVYLYKLKTKDFVQSKKMLLIR